ncbi:hypothetical protein Trydic_g9647 [Trypoxylus dichotomus]
MRNDTVKYREIIGAQFKTNGVEGSVNPLYYFMTMHVPIRLQNFTELFGWEQFDYSPYSPDLTESASLLTTIYPRTINITLKGGAAITNV